MKKNTIYKALFVVYGAVMLWLLLGREGDVPDAEFWPQVRAHINLVPFHTIRLYLRVLDSEAFRRTAIMNIFGNILLFVPLGYFLPLLWQRLRKWWRTWLMVLGIMLAVELTQLLTLRGYFDVDDLILNLLGAAVGYVVFRCLNPANKKK